ncbi:hypothetical protein DRH27_04625 [Candidatus Falkowbacteria bacterium]|nr:MAG: hypothetical protein DRH27_04625 [Candidatus Falkowbacteria bacterium]
MSTTNKQNLARNKINVSSQQYLDIAEIKENTVIMRDGTLRAVILISSINFALKSEDEQNAIISAYVSFLNNIDFPLQIVIQSRELNIDGYIKSLQEKGKVQTNELLKMQTNEYIQYINELISMSKIMNKRFYIVIPYNPMSDKQKKFFSRVLDVLKPATLIKMKEEKFRRRRLELTRRIDNAIGGLNSIGLNAVELDTQGLIELYYNCYNPSTSANQKLADVDELRLSGN